MSLWTKKAKQLTPWLYAVQDRIGSFIYILTGTQRALVFDTGYGLGNLPAAVRKVTRLPYIVVLSHGHTDHACGAYQFPQAFLHQEDIPLALLQTGRAYRGLVQTELKAHGILLPPWHANRYKEAGAGKLEALHENDVFSLGGMTVRCVPMPGHTAGSVGLLIEEHRVLLAGDAANRNLWLFLPESKNLSACADMLSRVRALEFDIFYMGHDDTPMNKESEFLLYESVLRGACAENAKRVLLASPFSHFESYSYTETNADGIEASVLFTLDKLNPPEVKLAAGKTGL